MKKNSFLVLAVCLLAACHRDSDFVPYSSVIKYTFSDTTKFLADDSSRVNVQIRTTGATDSDYFTVTFPVAGGTLEYPDASNKIYVQNNMASFNILSGSTAGSYPLSLQFKTKSQSYIQFIIPEKPSLPDLLLVEASRSVLDSTTTATVFTVTLKRLKGSVSTGLSIGASAYQLKNNVTVNVGRFTGLSPNKADSTGKVTLSYFSDTGGIDPSLPVYFKFYSLGSNWQQISAIYMMKFQI
jgi:hypothetical protein